jgi:hypothetical protein
MTCIENLMPPRACPLTHPRWQQRLVALAATREAICQQVHLIEEQKVQLAEQKLAEQQRLLHHMQLKLNAAQVPLLSSYAFRGFRLSSPSHRLGCRKLLPRAL